MSEKKNGNEFADMEKQVLTDDDLKAVSGGFKHYCKWRQYWVHDGQGLISCGELGVNYTLHKAPCDNCNLNAKG